MSNMPQSEKKERKESSSPAGDDRAESPMSKLVSEDVFHPEYDWNWSMHYDEVDPPLFTLLTTYLGYIILIVFGHLRDGFSKIFKPQAFSAYIPHNGYAPIVSDFDSFYTRRLKWRIQDCFSRAITGVAGAKVSVLERWSDDYNRTFVQTNKVRECINLSSYNYLGFASDKGECTDSVQASIETNGVSMCGSRCEGGRSQLHSDAEKVIAKYVGTEDSILISMGYATNATVIPALVERGALVISDELNHSSLVFGIRLSGASIRTFEHNSVEALERVLRKAISQGQPRTHRPWKKILVIVESLYSMEGHICPLDKIVALKDKYRFYLYVDEAHSIGALGQTGRGVCEQAGVDPRKVDILMGTFTKSFGAAGGYIAGSRNVIEHLRRTCHANIYAESMSPVVVQQILSSLRVIDETEEGRRKLMSIKRNSRYFMRRLKEMGFIVYGQEFSPVIPVLLFNPSKIPAFSREMYRRNIAVVVVGYPATPIITSRVRFCLSASHTIEMLDHVLNEISEVGDILGLKLLKGSPPIPHHVSMGPAEQKKQLEELEDEQEKLLPAA